ALDVDRASVRVDDALHDGEAHAAPARVLHARGGRAREEREDALAVPLGDAAPVVLHAERHLATFLARAHLDARRAVRVAVLDRVVEEVREELREALALAAHHGKM